MKRFSLYESLHFPVIKRLSLYKSAQFPVIKRLSLWRRILFLYQKWLPLYRQEQQHQHIPLKYQENCLRFILDIIFLFFCVPNTKPKTIISLVSITRYSYIFYITSWAKGRMPTGCWIINQPTNHITSSVLIYSTKTMIYNDLLQSCFTILKSMLTFIRLC
jgi:hypothetical protein